MTYYKRKQAIGASAFAGWALCAGLSASISCAEAIASRPNVLFISVDDLRPELGCYGQQHIHSPNIDRLAGRGVLFERAYCQFSHCSPSRASLLSGVRPGSRSVAADLPKHFKQQGWFTVSMGKVYHGTFSKEFDKTNSSKPDSWSVPAWYPPPRFYFSEEGIAKAEKRFAPQAKKLEVPVDQWTNHVVRAAAVEFPDVEDSVPRDGQIAERAVRQLRELDGKQPFFLAVGLMGTHLPFVAPQKYRDLYPADKIRLPDNLFAPQGAPDFSLIPLMETGQYSDLQDLASNGETALQMVRAYYSCVSYVDALIGKLLQALDETGLADNTIVVLWGDNGWKLGEHNAWSKYSNYEDDTRVPIILSAPNRVAAGKRTAALVELVDIYPTLCELCNLPVPDGLEGSSMVPVLQNPDISWKKAVFSVIPRNVSGGAQFAYDGKGYSIRTDRYRLVLWVKQKNINLNVLTPEADPEIVAMELYDHSRDPGENINCADNPEYAGVVNDLKQQLLAGWKAALPDSRQK